MTSGCDAASLNSQQTLAFKKGAENNAKSTLTVTTATADDLKMDKMKPGPNAEGWFLWPNATILSESEGSRRLHIGRPTGNLIG